MAPAIAPYGGASLWVAWGAMWVCKAHPPTTLQASSFESQLKLLLLLPLLLLLLLLLARPPARPPANGRLGGALQYLVWSGQGHVGRRRWPVHGRTHSQGYPAGSA